MADDDTSEATDGRPKIFKNLTAWIGGATAVVVALGGLAGAYHNIFPGGSAQTQANTAETTPSDAASPTADAQTAVTGYTTDDGGNIRLIDGMWVWTTKDGDKYRYKELSNDGTTTVAVLKEAATKARMSTFAGPTQAAKHFKALMSRRPGSTRSTSPRKANQGHAGRLPLWTPCISDI